MRVIVSNGCFKFHLAPAASELDRSGLLAAFLTAGYPTPAAKSWARRLGLATCASFGRLSDRGEPIADALVHPLWVPEIVAQAGRHAAAAFDRDEIALTAERMAMRRYAAAAVRAVDGTDADIYHYRSGYGGASVGAARRKGMLTLCDHSIADPRLIEYFIQHGGRYPSSPEEATKFFAQSGTASFWRPVVEDLLHADHILVNSRFVRQGLVFMGVPIERIRVLPLGVDDAFLDRIGTRSPRDTADGPIRLMYAGGLIARKGFPLLVRALERLADLPWTLTIAGGAEPAVLAGHARFLSDRRVRFLGTVARDELARNLEAADVFVFPSLVEGSARVVFEAMAAGCHVITTYNSGSIVQDGEHGRIVAAGSVDELERAIRATSADRAATAAIGRANQQLARARFRQVDYGQRLMALYRRLLTQRQADASMRATAAPQV